MKQLNITVVYTIKSIEEKVRYNCAVFYNKDGATIYINNFEIVVNNYTQFLEDVKVKVLKHLELKLTEVETININDVHL